MNDTRRQHLFPYYAKIAVWVAFSVTLVAVGLICRFRFGQVSRAAGDCTDRGANNFYVDRDSLCGSCDDARIKEANTVATPWCTVAKAAGVVAPGDTVNIQAGRYGEDFNFTISGTAMAPITYQGLGIVVIGTFDDVADESFQPTAGLANVYEQTYARAKGGNDVGYQTHFDPILVDDDGETNPAKFTVLEQDGPITLAYVPSTAEVQRVEGSWLIENGKLYVHPYGNRLPSSANTDIVIGVTEGARHDVTANFNNFYDVGFGYNAMEEMRVTGQYNRFVNNFGLRGVSGSYNYVENAVAANLFYRLPAGDYSWIEQAEGWGFGVAGSYNTVKNVQVYHNFNNFIASGDHQTISNVVAHGAPNHGFETSDLTDSTIMNVVGFGNQDIFYIRGGLENIVYEGFTAQDGITFEEQQKGKSSGLTFRNNIFGSCWIGEGGYGVSTCEYESTVTIENSIFMCDPGEQLRIQHCVNANMSTDPIYTLAEYQAGCQAGTIANCMTLRNLQVVNDAGDYARVLAGGRYVFETDLWDVHIPGVDSPARNAGSEQTLATVDFENDIRPRGGAYDIGADEYDENSSPILAPIGNKTIHESDTLTFTITATDADPGDTVSLTATNLPSGATFSDHLDRTGTFVWTPTTDQAGVYPDVHFAVSDATTSVSEDITITIQDGVSNCVPAWQCSDWSICADSLQSRICTDANQCGTDAGRPTESAGCDSTAPSAVIDLHSA